MAELRWASRDSTLEAIARRIVRGPDWGLDREDWFHWVVDHLYCRFCAADAEIFLVSNGSSRVECEHEPDCPYATACAWVEAHPEGSDG